MGASTKVLGDLHEAVASALSEQVKGYTVVEDDQEKVIKPSPALLGAAITFLKNNNITADASDNEALRNLNDALKARQKRKITPAAMDRIAADFSDSFGNGSLIQ